MKAVAVALRNRFRRQQVDPQLRDDILPKNILMIGPTGVGKTEIARRLASLARAPFVKVEATKFTEVGYVGRDVDSMVRDLAQVAVRLVENEKIESVKEEAEERALERIVEMLHPPRRRKQKKEDHDSAEVIRATFGSLFGQAAPAQAPVKSEDDHEDEDEDDKARERDSRIRAKLLEQIKNGVHDDKKVDIEVEQSH